MECFVPQPKVITIVPNRSSVSVDPNLRRCHQSLRLQLNLCRLVTILLRSVKTNDMSLRLPRPSNSRLQIHKMAA